MIMNLSNALDILDIHHYSDVNIQYLKKKYYKLALENHPDKNGNTDESNEKFKQINEAYHYLKREIIHTNSYMEPDKEEEQSFSYGNGYSEFLQLFISTFFQGNYTEIFSTILKDIISGCTKITLKLFEHLDKEKSMDVYSFLSKHKKIFRLNQDILEQVKNIVLEKCKEDELYILNPSIDDLFENNVYKLFIDGQLYLVPLWHNECYFDGPKGDIIVKCVPNLPNYISIDEDNNIIVDLYIPFEFSLLEQKTISLNLGKKQLLIPIHELFIKKTQIVLLSRQGITIINDDIYDLTQKSDIFVKIHLI